MGFYIKGPCLDCPDRNAGCHGKTEDGTWRCSRWAAYQAEQETFHAKAAEDLKRVEVAMDNKALAEFGVLFRQAQETVNRLTELVGELDEENRPKVYRALGALRNMIAEKAGEATA